MTNRSFPNTRLRRNRFDDATRRLVAEHKLSTDDLIWPIFIREGSGEATPIASMPGVSRTGLDGLVKHVEAAARLKIPAIALFPATPAELKNPTTTEALNANNLMCQAARVLKAEFPDIALVGDVALDPYTDHGHDGILEDGYVVNDQSVGILVQQAVNQAAAGIDIIAPSDMMDGRIGAIRAGLDEAGFINTRIMSYAAKYASAFYGPFRDAIGSGGALKGDKKTYQMNPANAEEALHEVALDLAEGADMVMVKPAMTSLDVLAQARSLVRVPLAAYHVSGEYAMVKAADAAGWIDGPAVALEQLTVLKRAGADFVLTYFAIEVAEALGG